MIFYILHNFLGQLEFFILLRCSAKLNLIAVFNSVFVCVRKVWSIRCANISPFAKYKYQTVSAANTYKSKDFQVFDDSWINFDQLKVFSIFSHLSFPFLSASLCTQFRDTSVKQKQLWSKFFSTVVREKMITTKISLIAVAGLSSYFSWCWFGNWHWWNRCCKIVISTYLISNANFIYLKGRNIPIKLF